MLHPSQQRLVRSGPCRSPAPVLIGLLIGIVAFGWQASPALQAQDLDFRRGDANGDGQVDISDALRTFAFLFLGGSPPGCLDAADSNDSSVVDLSDGIYTLGFLFLGGDPLPPPGHEVCGPDPTGDTLDCNRYSTPDCEQGPTGEATLREIGHVLNRLGYGPTLDAVSRIREIGITAYIEEQLNPLSIDESENIDLLSREEALFSEVLPARDRRIIAAGDLWTYLPGTEEPPAEPIAWNDPAFDDAAWLSGPSGVGYGDSDDETVLEDMRYNYVSVYLRKAFFVSSPAELNDLVLRVDYDDGFVAYLNGTEVARRGLSGNPPPYNATTPSGHEAITPEEIDITSRKGLLAPGKNVLAIQVHNTSIDSSDLTMIPELIDRELLPVPPRRVISGVAELQELLHVRGIYSERQLQATLAEFWENHFTTDVDKVTDYLDELQNSDASDAMSEGQARLEAARMEHAEYEFFYRNALGNFGDLLLYSSTSPSMLIYLDNVLNYKGNANENYAREILELHAHGVDNRYVQRDIEELARCFTGWTVCKVSPLDVTGFPASATEPPQVCGVQFSDTPLVDVGAGWRYLKGTAEPSPAGDGSPTTDWTLPGFDDTGWLTGSTGIGYGDGDDATLLGDMRYSYASVYLRRTFEVADPAELTNLIFEVSYDDGFIAYLNGTEVARSGTLEGRGSPPAHDTLTMDNHEVSEGPELHNWNRYRELLVPGTNVLAIQVHNTSLGSSDLSMIPRVVDREILPGSIENGDPSGVWVFRFDPALHDTASKSLFEGTPYETQIPGGRTGPDGIQDALDVVQNMVHHPSTAEFICIKLIQKFVSDGLTLAEYRAGTAPDHLVELLQDAITAWNSTSPPGNIRVVLETIFDPVDRQSEFWNERNFSAKVKTPVEFINSTVRALDGQVSGTVLRSRNSSLGMEFFERDDPDGWPELGFRWIDTSSLLGRIKFAQSLAENRDGRVSWDPEGYLDAQALSTSEEIVDHFGDLLFQGTLSAEEKSLLLNFLTTDQSGTSRPLDPADPDYEARIAEFVGFALSLPRWHFQ